MRLYAASTTKAEQMLTAVKLTEYKDKALKEGLSDDMLADEDALMELLEKVGVAGGFAMKGENRALVPTVCINHVMFAHSPCMGTQKRAKGRQECRFCHCCRSSCGAGSQGRPATAT